MSPLTSFICQGQSSAKRTHGNIRRNKTSKNKKTKHKKTESKIKTKVKRKSKLHHVIAGKRHETTKTENSTKQGEKSETDKENKVFGSLINDEDILPMTYNEANAHTG